MPKSSSSPLGPHFTEFFIETSGHLESSVYVSYLTPPASLFLRTVLSERNRKPPLLHFHFYTRLQGRDRERGVCHNTTPHNATQRNATQRNATQRNATQPNATQYTTIQYRSLQHHTTQSDTTKHNQEQHNITKKRSGTKRDSVQHNKTLDKSPINRSQQRTKQINC
jgi:hypothetical protein